MGEDQADHAGIGDFQSVESQRAAVAGIGHGHPAGPRLTCMLDGRFGRPPHGQLPQPMVPIDPCRGGHEALDAKIGLGIDAAQTDTLRSVRYPRNSVGVDPAEIRLDQRAADQLGVGGAEPGGHERIGRRPAQGGGETTRLSKRICGIVRAVRRESNIQYNT